MCAMLSTESAYPGLQALDVAPWARGTKPAYRSPRAPHRRLPILVARLSVLWAGGATWDATNPGYAVYFFRAFQTSSAGQRRAHSVVTNG